LDERQPKRSLADDLNFLESLSELDRGLSGTLEPEADVQPLPQVPPPRPLVPRPSTRVPPAPLTPPPAVAAPITIAAPPPLAAQAAPTPSAVALPAPPPWLPQSAFAAISAASTALSEAFESPSTESPAAPGAPAAVPAAVGPRTLRDLFPPAASREATAPDLPLRDRAVPPPIAAVAPPRVTVRRRADAAPAPPRGATYETFYGLDEKPFATRPDVRFLYHNSAHDRVLQGLLASIAKRDAVAVLTGDAGIGKTMLCRTLVDQIDRRTLVSFVSGAVPSPDELLKTLLVDFGVISRDEAAGGRLASASRDDLAGALRDFLGSLAAIPASALLIVDDAHMQPAAVLRELGSLSDVAAAGQLLRIVLVGEPGLTPLLRTDDHRAINDRVAVRAELGPLEEDEVAGYVAHRLAVAGRGERVGFGDGALRRIFELSRGVPGVVNQICDRALTLGYQASASRIDLGCVAQAAEQIGFPADAGASWRDRVLLAVLMLVLMLAGAAGAGWVFRAPLNRAWTAWHGDGPSTTPTPR